MESILNLIFNAENVRMLVILAFVCCAYMLSNRKMDRMEYSLNKRIDGVDRRIDGVEASIKELKYNDFAHLNATIEALAYALDKGFYVLQQPDVMAIRILDFPKGCSAKAW